MSAAFREHGWRTVTLDSDPKHGADIQMDILDFQPSLHLPADITHVDLVWGSPLCTFYSVMRQCGVRGMATQEQLQFSDCLVRKALQIAEELQCKILLENPWTGALKNRGILDHLTMHRVDYCKYSRPYKNQRVSGLTPIGSPHDPRVGTIALQPSRMLRPDERTTPALSGAHTIVRKSLRNSVRRSRSTFRDVRFLTDDVRFLTRSRDTPGPPVTAISGRFLGPLMTH